MRMGTKRPGGRSADNLARIVGATGELLVEKGYARLSAEEVAERAGVHRSTVHRRFPTRAELVAHLMTTLARERVPVPDTGSLAGDLLAFATRRQPGDGRPDRGRAHPGRRGRGRRSDTSWAR